MTDIRKVSIGPAEIFMGSLGVTPSTYVGFSYDDCTIEMAYQNPRDYFLGVPQIPSERIPATRIITTLNFSMVEWDLEKFATFLGLQVASTSTQFVLSVRDFNPDPIAIYLKNQKPDGSMIEVLLYKVVFARNFSFPFTHRLHRFPMSFEVLWPTVDFAGQSPTCLFTIVAPRVT